MEPDRINLPSRIINISRDSGLDPRYHLAAIVDSSDDPIMAKDLQGTILTWNGAATRIFGYQPEEIVGASVLSLIPPELHHEQEDILRKLRAGERIEQLETIHVKKTGERFPVSVTISPIRDDNGRVIGASKIARDISERKRLEETRARLAAIVESADDAIIGKDLNGIIRSWNSGAARMFGYSALEIIGTSVRRLIPDDLQYEEEQILAKLRTGERIEHYETTRKKKSGELVQISATISPIRDESGRIIGASKIARDISDRKRVERLLIQSEKLAATGRMAAAIAHEINNPLESLMNLIYLAREHSTPGGSAHEFLLTAEDELERVSHIARQTLGFYRESGKPAEVYLHDLLDNVLTVYNAKLITHSVTVQTRYTDLQKILVSRGEMLQIFSNLIVNSIDAMRGGGKLFLSARKTTSAAADGVQVIIRDTGSGIPQANLARVFEPFFTTKGNLGTGVGLWVARQLIEQRGGNISLASSTTPGSSGTTITLFVPFAPPVTTTPIPAH
jgi:PAS domain S-box-containing protein